MAHVVHTKLDRSHRALILATDGLRQFYGEMSLEEASEMWISSLISKEGLWSLKILREALGDDDDEIAGWLEYETTDENRRLDDTTITVVNLAAPRS